MSIVCWAQNSVAKSIFMLRLFEKRYLFLIAIRSIVKKVEANPIHDCLKIKSIRG